MKSQWSDVRPDHDLVDRDTPHARLLMKLRDLERRLSEQRGAIRLLKGEREKIKAQIGFRTVKS